MNRNLFVICTLFLALSCESPSESDSADVLADTSPPTAPAGCEVSPAPADFTYPAGPYGVGVGDVVENIALEDCDGNTVELADVLASGELVLLNIGAGWCQPCIKETETLVANVFEPHCGGGLRVVQMLFQNDGGAPSTKFFCRAWRDRYGLSFPVLNDPLFLSQTYFSGEDTLSATPINLLIDSAGVIRFKSTGEIAEEELIQRIESLLPTP